MMIDSSLKAYFDALVERQGLAQDVPRETVSFADGTMPLPHACHANVDRFVAEQPACIAVRGWVISGRLGTAILLDAHSVVSRPDGSWIDITLKPEDQRAPFVAHKGDDSLFEAIRSRVNRMAWPPVGHVISA